MLSINRLRVASRVAALSSRERDMAQFHSGDEQYGRSVPFELPKGERPPSRLLAGIYRAVGLAAVANELEISKVDLDPELVKAVERGALYLRRLEVRPSLTLGDADGPVSFSRHVRPAAPAPASPATPPARPSPRPA